MGIDWVEVWTQTSPAAVTFVLLAHTTYHLQPLALASNLLAMASNPKAMAFNLLLVTFVLLVHTTYHLLAKASNLRCWPQLPCDGLQPKNNGL